MAGVSSVSLGLLSSVALVAVMGITYALSTKIVKKINKPYPIVLGNFMIFIGLYFCLCLLILPNISSLTSGSAVQIQSLTDIGYMLIAVIGLVILGIIYTKRKSDLIEF